MPVLCADELHDEDVMRVGVRRERSGVGGREIRIRLERMGDVSGQVAYERSNRRTRSMQRLIHDRRSAGEQSRELVGVDHVDPLPAKTQHGGVAGRVQVRSVPHDADGGPPRGMTNQVVGDVDGEDVAEIIAISDAS